MSHHDAYIRIIQTFCSGTIIAHPLASTCDVVTICEIKSVALSDPNICRRSQNLKFRPLDLITPVCGYFVKCEIRVELATIYSCTKIRRF